MPAPGRSQKEQKEKSWLEKAKDTFAKRENPKDPQSRVGIGGRTRANRIDAALEEAETGRKK